MKREIFVVSAFIVDANGTFNPLTGYPKAFDSRHYDNNIEKTRQRAYSDYYETLSAMYKRDDRQVQIVTVMQVNDNAVLNMHKLGVLAELPDPDPEPEE